MRYVLSIISKPKERNIMKAIVEANKLKHKHNSVFTIYGALHSTDGEYMKVENSKQKEQGTHKPNTARVFAELQDYIKNNKDTVDGKPTKIYFSAEGKFLVDVYKDGYPECESKVFGTIEELTFYINNFLIANKKN